jgi:hypothetical protein
LQKGTDTPVQIAYKAGGGKANCLIPKGVAPGNDYRITVVSVNNPNVKGVSGTFTIEPAPTIKVTSPNGGEVWHRGNTYNITWTYTGKPEMLKIMLVPYNNMVDGKIIAQVPPGSNGSGAYSWKIPNDAELRSDYRIWLVYSVGSEDMSDQNFTIAPITVSNNTIIKDVVIVDKQFMPDAITVVKPEEGEVLQMGKTYTVSWKPAFNTNLQGPMQIELMQGDTVREKLSSAGGLPATGSLNWNIGLNDMYVAPGLEYRIRVTSINDAKLHGYSGGFTLIKPSITLTSPVEWTQLQRGQTYKISWTVTGDCGPTADIYLTIWSDKVIVDTIAANVPMSQGSVDWTVPWYDDQTMDKLKPNGILVVQTHGNADIFGRIRVTVK